MGAPSGSARPVIMVGVYFARTGIGLLATKPCLKTLGVSSHVAPLRLLAAMGKRFTPAELEKMHQLKAQGITPAEIHRCLAKQRSSSRRAP